MGGTEQTSMLLENMEKDVLNTESNCDFQKVMVVNKTHADFGALTVGCQQCDEVAFACVPVMFLSHDSSKKALEETLRSEHAKKLDDDVECKYYASPKQVQTKPIVNHCDEVRSGESNAEEGNTVSEKNPEPTQTETNAEAPSSP